MKYGWKDGARVARLDADVVGNHLNHLEEKNGELTAAIVLADAKRKRSPIHAAFEWDDTEAAHQYRLTQARALVRSVTIVWQSSGGETQHCRARVHTGASYERMEVVAQEPDKYERLVAQGRQELASVREKYGEIEEFKEVWSAIDAHLEAA